MLYAHKLTATRRALEKSSCSQGLGLEQGAACHPPDPHYFFILPAAGGGDSRLFGPMCLLFLNRCREWFHCLRSFSFLFFSFLFFSFLYILRHYSPGIRNLAPARTFDWKQCKHSKSSWNLEVFVTWKDEAQCMLFDSNPRWYAALTNAVIEDSHSQHPHLMAIISPIYTGLRKRKLDCPHYHQNQPCTTTQHTKYKLKAHMSKHLCI